MNNSLPLNAPVDMAMPEPAQLYMNFLMWGFVVIVLLLALNHWRKSGSSIGVWFILGGALTTLNEPIVDILGKCWFPAINSWVLLKAWGVSIPVHMIPVYAWYVGGQSFFSYRRFEKGISVRGVFGLYALFAGINILLEVPGVSAAQPMYSYFGYQPLVLLKFPLWWMFCNALMPMAAAAVVFRCDSLLLGARRVFIIPLTWMLAAATNALIAAPIWVALNATNSSLTLTNAAAVVSFVFGLIVCYAIAVTVAIDAPKIISRREAQAA